MRYIYTIMFLMCTLLANAQGHESYYLTRLSNPLPMYTEEEKMSVHKEYKQTIYWEKHNKFKKYAFTALGLGVCGTIVGWIGEVGNNAHTNSNWKKDGKAWDIVLCTGIGLTVSSIPLFIISHKNKVKAKKYVDVSINATTAQNVTPYGQIQTQPMCSISIEF